jgi:hypothetical protein
VKRALGFRGASPSCGTDRTKLVGVCGRKQGKQGDVSTSFHNGHAPTVTRKVAPVALLAPRLDALVAIERSAGHAFQSRSFLALAR